MHCSATREDMDYGPVQMERDHKARGFRSAGYNFYVRKTGEVVLLRPLELIPAHAFGYNANSIGICYEGGLDKRGKPADTRTLAQKQCLESILKNLLACFPESKLCGHRDLSPDRNADGIISANEWIKVCPCFDVKNEYSYLTDQYGRKEK